MKNKRVKAIITQIKLYQIMKELTEKFSKGQLQRDKVQKIYKSFFILQHSFNRFKKKFGPNLEERQRGSIKKALTFGFKAKYDRQVSDNLIVIIIVHQ